MTAERVATVVIGSGFGGAVAACRLAQRGERVVVLERGRRWSADTFPRAPSDPWIFDVARPDRRNGWLDLRFFPDMVVAQGAGVGGGSLIYANVSVPARPETFHRGWPSEITFDELEPHYREAGRMLGATTLPDQQETSRLALLREAANAIGAASRFRKLPLAVTFDPDYRLDLPDPHDRAHSRQRENAAGRTQGTCIHLGECDIGCPVLAKNTLDLNYLAVAEDHHADVRPLHLARAIEPDGDGYLVRYDQIDPQAQTLSPGQIRAARVILAAGSLGTTELLLRCRDQHHTLPRLSRRLGYGWSSNGDFLTPARHPGRTPPIDPTRGPTIAGAIDFLDGIDDRPAFFIEDGGLPNLVRAFAEDRGGGGFWRGWLRRRLRAQLARFELARDVMPWFAQAVDAADGRLRLARRWFAPWRRALTLDWDVAASKPVIDAVVAMHRKLARATGGDPDVPFTWTLFKNLATPHPLGGCNIGTTAENGVVDHAGRVFNYPGLYVTDGAAIPEAIGLNPSRTIAALAERAVAMMA